MAAVRERKARGCDLVKVMATGGGMTPTTPMWMSQFDTEQLGAVVRTAHDLGLAVAVHCHGIGGIVSAVAAGVDTIEHCTFMAESGRSEPDEAILDSIVAARIAVSATLGALPGAEPPPFVKANLATMMGGARYLHDAGATIVVGTDAGVGLGKPHDVLPHALGQLNEIGMTGIEPLQTMTAVAARVIRLGDRKGRLAPGYDADVVAFGGDVTESLLDVRGVWLRGVRV